jgi:hypothetical protein
MVLSSPCALLDTFPAGPYYSNSFFADVAELADAQVSEACDGDIVEVQVLSSAPVLGPVRLAGPFSFDATRAASTNQAWETRPSLRVLRSLQTIVRIRNQPRQARFH